MKNVGKNVSDEGKKEQRNVYTQRTRETDKIGEKDSWKELRRKISKKKGENRN